MPPRSPIDNVAVAQRLGSLTADGRNPAWDSLDAKRRADLARRMAVYAAMVENMDANIGRLVASLRQHGELENTLILFLSDNGACAEWEPFGFDLDPARFRNPASRPRDRRGTPGSPNVLHEGEALAAMGGPDSLFSYGCAWANLCNTPLSLYKHYAHEGGIRTPLIAHWPARIVGQGELRPHVAHLMDIMATCVEVTGAKYPAAVADKEILPMSGRSLLPALLHRPAEPRTLIFEHERNAAIRAGDWKLVGRNILGRDGLRPEARWELYDLPATRPNSATSPPRTPGWWNGCPRRFWKRPVEPSSYPPRERRRDPLKARAPRRAPRTLVGSRRPGPGHLPDVYLHLAEEGRRDGETVAFVGQHGHSVLDAERFQDRLGDP